MTISKPDSKEQDNFDNEQNIYRVTPNPIIVPAE